MKYIYGLNKSGLSLINYFDKNKEVFVVWDDDKKKDIVFHQFIKK